MRIKGAKGKLTAWLCMAALLYTLAGCNEATMLGQDMIPGNGFSEAIQTDTFTVRTHTISPQHDSVASSLQTSMAAGAINSDPVFGKTTAITYLQTGLTTSGFSFAGPVPVLDSVVLSLAYDGYYGDSMNVQKFTVFKVADPAFADTTYPYYAHQYFNLDQSAPLGTAMASAYSLKDSVEIYGHKFAPQLRVRLSDHFGQELIQQKSDGALANDSAFHTWLNGLALVPDSITSGKKSMLYFELNSAYTGIMVYYHNSTEDSLLAFFPFNPKTGAWSNYIGRNYSGSEASEYLKDSSALTSDSLIYLQNKPGLYVNIDIPYLKDFSDALINKAELIITQVRDPDAETFQAPGELFLWKYKQASKDTLGYLVDVGAVVDPRYGFQFTNLNYFGGFRKMITNGKGEKIAQYRFNITRYMQHLVSPLPSYHETNYGFRLGVMNPLNNFRDVGRVVLGGGNHSTYSMKLHVVYTRIK